MQGLSQFLSDLSNSAGLKFILAGLSFLFLGIPAAISVTLGLPGTAVLYAVCALLAPFMYALYCLLAAIFVRFAAFDRMKAESIDDVGKSGLLRKHAVPDLRRVILPFRLKEKRISASEIKQTISTPTFSKGDEVSGFTSHGQVIYSRS